jgi:hypothetical protein
MARPCASRLRIQGNLFGLKHIFNIALKLNISFFGANQIDIKIAQKMHNIASVLDAL